MAFFFAGYLTTEVTDMQTYYIYIKLLKYQHVIVIVIKTADDATLISRNCLKWFSMFNSTTEKA